MFRPSKGRGQNFLVDGGVARRFVGALEAGPGRTVLEIGPGKGALTRPLLETGARVVAVEIEAELASELAAEGLAGLQVVQGDFLELGAADLPSPPPEGWLVISNVPYSITGPLLGRLLGGELPVARVVVGLQLEVAERLAAPPGSRTYGSLSVLAACFGPARAMFRIPPGCFRPRPKVDSRVVRIDRDPARVPMGPGSALERVVGAAFATRRKTILNSLGHGLGRPRDELLAALGKAGIDPVRRAETVGAEEFRGLCAALNSLSGPPPVE